MEATIVILTAIAVTQPQTSTRISEAYAKQIALDRDLERLKHTLLTGNQIKHVDRIAIITKVIVDRQVQLIWTFP